MIDDPLHRFIFLLALKLGMTRGQLVRSMSYRELIQWAAFYQIDPWGEERADGRTDILANLLVKVNNPDHHWTKFTPTFDEPEPEEQSLEQMLLVAKMHTAITGKKRG